MNAPAARAPIVPTQLILGPRDRLVNWAAARIAHMHGQTFPASATAVGVGVDGELAGVIVFSDWRPRFGTMQVSAAAVDARWMRCRAAFDWMWNYAFCECDVTKLWSVTPARNRRALKFVWGLGFEEEARLARHFGDDDAVISRRFRDDHYNNRHTGRSTCLR